MSTLRTGSANPDGALRRSHRLNTGQPTKQPTKPSAALLAAKRKAKQRSMNKKPNDIVRDIYQNAMDAKVMSLQPTGLVYDRRMAEHRCLWDSTYPECPERLTRVLERCEELGLLKHCKEIPVREATETELLAKHTPEQIEILKATENVTEEDYLEKLSSKYDAIYIHPSTYRLSLLAAGSTIELVENICKGSVHNGMAIIRPPGHHAMKSEYCGYCFFNNVAVAANHALENLGLSRILIIDWDVHHGQATQQMFYDDPRVVYFSIHRYEHGTFWPNLRESDFDYVGKGKGAGFNFNVPLNATGMADADYLAIFQQVLLPMACEFQPELIIVSAGYDAAIGCPEGEMEVTPAFYAHLINSLSALSNGKLAVVLEGGYCLRSLAEGAALTLRALLGHPTPQLPPMDPPCDVIRNTILDVIYSHRSHWDCFKMQDTWSLAEQENKEPETSLQARHIPRAIFFGPNGPPPTSFETRNCYPVQSSVFLMSVASKLNSLISSTKLYQPPHKMCVVYDSRMLKHFNRNEESHPERPERVSSIQTMLEDYGLLQRSHILPPRVATEEELLMVHTQSHITAMQSLANESQEEMNKQQEKLHSVYLHNNSYESASVAAGCVLQVVDSVLTGESATGVAVVRPPGHHAESDKACGFCVFNNVSLAAKYAIEKHGLSRVLLVDWDVHHGNGTQHIFESDPRVLYISLHRYDNGNFFPGSLDAGHDRVGTGKGEGFNVNIPWNKKGMSDGDYVAAFHQIVLPIAYQFNPELVLVSAGFDAAVGDPLGGCKVSPECYGHLTHWLKALAGGRVVLCLEGGYNLNSISYAMTMCSKALLGDPLPMLEQGSVASVNGVQSIRTVVATQQKYWPCLKFQVALPLEDDILSSQESSEDLTRMLAKVQLTEREISMNHHKDHDASTTKTTTAANYTPMVAAPAPDHSKAGSSSDANSSAGTSAGGSGEGSSFGSARGGDGSRPTLVDFLSENMQMLAEERMFAVVPLSDCPHLPSVEPVPERGIDTNALCESCSSPQENWTCLVCYKVLCGRYVNEHMSGHGHEVGHPLTLSFSDLSVWCYECEAYIDNAILYAAKNAAHRSKFGEDLPWSYGDQ
ncbi:histone deacetylase 6 isoform X1 [Thrips palmi]|uniref:Protein deacetylase HDAC6 n=2 Tax=Thrips palmi TaxID=161013 RepID=A0A6P9A5T8_THRPL|nr:histone deacetylase 6 isoform X1 [Thrips palmi]XP_034252880.1 histone deacetylase 6 isoform X1 [Thrips palmi]